MTTDEIETTLVQTQLELAKVKETLGTLIVWMAQSAGSPISVRDAERLLQMLPPQR